LETPRLPVRLAVAVGAATERVHEKLEFLLSPLFGGGEFAKVLASVDDEPHAFLNERPDGGDLAVMKGEAFFGGHGLYGHYTSARRLRVQHRAKRQRTSDNRYYVNFQRSGSVCIAFRRNHRRLTFALKEKNGPDPAEKVRAYGKKLLLS